MTDKERNALYAKVSGSSFGDLLGFEPVESQPGHVKLRLPFSEKLLQSLGRVLGGVIFSLADHASGWAAFSTLDKDERCATLEMKINYIAAVRTEDCIAEAKVVHKGRTSIVVESEVKTVNDKLIARTLATFIVLKHRAEGGTGRD